jgi:hypothetical protein
VHRQREVENHEYHELPLLAPQLDEGLSHPGGDVPVDRADVVAALVLAHSVEIDAPAPERRLE